MRSRIALLAHLTAAFAIKIRSLMHTHELLQVLEGAGSLAYLIMIVAGMLQGWVIVVTFDPFPVH